MYNPNLNRFEDVEMTKELKRLVAVISEQVHDNWAAARLNEGWSYGEFRDDLLKKHPGLIPYDELTETEKDYDRLTVETVIKYLVENGYDIMKKDAGK